MPEEMTQTDFDIAIVGMAGRFPGAANLDEFWRNLAVGIESVAAFTDEEVRAAGIDPTLARDPHYVKAGGVLDGAEWFDARFFNIYPREAEIMDPQHRVFLELAWEALENAGYDPATYPKMIGVYAGASLNSYLLFNLLENAEIQRTVQPYQLTIANDKDFLPTRVSYKLNLRGPSIAVQTACSTSLVATHLACQALLNYQCDMALAGGVTIRLPQRGGYLYQEGGIASPDGHCRAFDADAAGTVGGNGAGIVVLKRLADALAERDTIHAVIKATALNNDGSSKVGYTAPSVEGQADVIATAQAIAGIDARTISYIEAHGTGTALGDPIEIAALTQVFRQSTADRQFCAVGSLKSNIGHLDAAAGVASLIKTTLALEHRQIPASLNYREPNPRIDFADSPFYVNTSLREWQPAGKVRRAGVSAFGIGGTNAHAVLEEAPLRIPSGPSRPWQLLALSARSSDALNQVTGNLAADLSATAFHQEDAGAHLADVAYTLMVGRRAFEHRRIALVSSLADTMSALADSSGPRVMTNDGAAVHRSVAFMFTGQGSQYPDMTAGLYRTEPVYRAALDECALLLAPHLGFDLRTLILPGHFPGASGDLHEQLRRTAITQPALFAVEYALAQLWLAWGVRPDALIGHSIGEYAAACLAGVLTLADALAVVAARGRLMEALPGGAMLSVPLSESEVRERLRKPEAHGLAVAAVNAPTLAVVSGSPELVARFEHALVADGIAARRLHTSHAFHSAMMDSILSPFAEVMRSVRLSAPVIPYISNVTGTWITAEQATDPAYYAQHLRQTVRFADGLSVLADEPSRALLEVGPGRTMVTLARQHPTVGQGRAVVASLPGPVGTRSRVEEETTGDDQAYALMALGRLWLAGIVPDWDPAQGQPGQPWAAFYAGEARARVPLPTYPFERERYWVEPSTSHTTDQPAAASVTVEGRLPPENWLYAPLWKQAPPVQQTTAATERWLVLAHDNEADRRLLAALSQYDRIQLTTVVPGPAYAEVGETGHYEIRPGNELDYARLFDALTVTERLPQAVLHLWTAGSCDLPHAGQGVAPDSAEGFSSLVALARAWLVSSGGAPLRVAVVTSGISDITGDEPLLPEHALVLGPCRVIPQEHPNIDCRVIDLARQAGRAEYTISPTQLLAELQKWPTEPLVAYRAGRRWQPILEPLTDGDGSVPLLEQGLYLITGGLGRIGSVLAEHLAGSCRARLALVDRTGLPPHETWGALLAAAEPDSIAARKVRHIRRLQELGSEVLVVQADVAEPAQMATALAQVDEHFGPGALRGVIHAAGLVGAAAVRAVTETTAADSDAQFAPKVDGARALAAALGDRPLDFVLLMSSLATVLGGLGFASYTAANSFLDTFASQQRRLRPQQGWMSVAWEGWNFQEEDALGRAMQAHAGSPASYSLSPAEGAATFARVLALPGLSQVVVSTGDLAARRGRWAVQAAEGASTQAAARPAMPGAATRYARPKLHTPYVTPGDDLEAAIAADWESIIGIAPVGVHDDFFELGGHSLLATQIVSRLRDTYRVDLPLRNIFETPTVAGLAALIRAGQVAATGSPDEARPLDTIPRVPRTVGEDGLSLLPLSYGQQRLWFLDRLDPGSPLYNNFAALRLTAPAGGGTPVIDAARLQAALAEVVQRHEVLRTVFFERAGIPVQRILPEMPVAFTVTDLREASGLTDRAAIEAEVLRLAKVEARAPFDLTSGPLFRARLLHTGADEAILFFTMHHIVSDGWSVGVLLREVVALLGTGNRASALLELPIQYGDYAAWQRVWLAGTPSKDDAGVASQLSAQLAYWRGQLAGEPAPLELPTDRPRPAVQTSHGANHWFRLPARLYEQLDALARGEGATLFMALLAGLDVLLYRYTGQSDLAVGTPIANRDRTETQPLIGFLLNTLVLRTQVSPDLSFRRLLRHVREVALGAYAHQEVPFEMLVEALKPTRDMSRSPFFQVMFDLQAAPLEGLTLPGLTMTRLDVDPGTAKFDLALSMEYAPGSLGGYLNYNRDLFDSDSIAQMLRHFEALLSAAVNDPDGPLARLPMLGPEEERRILSEWNVTSAPETPPAAAGATVLAMFEAQVRARPTAPAVMLAADLHPHTDWSEELTYAGLNARAEALAQELKTCGIGPETIVALLLERSLDMMTAIVAVLKTGAAFLPIDPAYPPERIRFVLEDSAARALIKMEDDKLKIEMRSTYHQSTLTSFASPGVLAYVIYTSGSTGQPKGVLVEAGGLAQHIRTVAATFDLRPGDRILQFAAYTFDQGVEQILTAMAVGGTLVMRGPDVWPPEDFPQIIARYGLNSVNLPPAYLAQMLREWSRSQAPIPEGQLRTIISGGDVLSAEILQLWQSTPARSARLLNAYGPTEATITALVFDASPDWFESGPGHEGRPVPIGRPLAGRIAYVVDRNGNPVPDGVPGELLLGGVGIARGYLARPELTAEKFVPNPYLPVMDNEFQVVRAAARPGGRPDQEQPSNLQLAAIRLYRTGDLVRRRRDGCIEFMGRIDQQVKIRGFRIELGEIEAALLQQPGVRQGTVVARPDAGGMPQLVAYFVPSGGPQHAEPGPAELRVALMQTLPAYMVPAAYIRLERLPLTPTGKVDRRALPAPDESALAMAGERVAPRTPIEQEIAAVWAGVLGLAQSESGGVAPIGIYDNFFDLGGHSLLATQIVSRLRERYPIDLPLRKLFEAPTIAGLAAALEAALLEQENEADLLRLLNELEELSDDELGRLLTDDES